MRLSQIGYSLFELIVVIIILGIIATIAIRSVSVSSDIARVEKTKRELDQLAWAIAGNPDLRSGGKRTDFGYVGDIGALPASLDALVANPGFGTWRGPYIQDDFYAGAAAPASEFKFDEWGTAYDYSGGVTIASTGSGSSLTRQVAASPDNLLRNRVSVVVTDVDRVPPGATYRDSLNVLLTIPDGAGATTIKARTPGIDGFAEFDSIPIGNHLLQIVTLPTGDTLARRVVVEPGGDPYLAVILSEALW